MGKRNMRNLLLFPPIFFIFIFITNISFAQETILSSGGDGADTGGTFSYTFGQFAFETYFELGNSVVQGIQHPFEIIWIKPSLSLVDTTIQNGSLTCFNAMQTIKVAGDGNPVKIQNMAVVDFIAGKSIHFLPGFIAQSGSQVHGYISSDGIFCSVPFMSSIVEASPQVKEVKFTEQQKENDNLSLEMQVKVYPNPNNGKFTIDLINFENKASISIYDLTGSMFFESKMDQTINNELNFSFLRKGIYFLKVTSNNKQFVKKILIN
jgi:hypothetical protein